MAATSNMESRKMTGLVISNKEYDFIMGKISKMKPSKRKNYKGCIINPHGVKTKLRFINNELVNYEPRNNGFIKVRPHRLLGEGYKLQGPLGIDDEFVKGLDVDEITRLCNLFTHTGKADGKARKVIATKNKITLIKK